MLKLSEKERRYRAHLDGSVIHSSIYNMRCVPESRDRCTDYVETETGGVIPTGTGGVDVVERFTDVTVSSALRDMSYWFSSAEWRTVLNAPLRNVVQVSVPNACIPMSEYNVNSFNNWLDVDIGGTVFSVQLPVGNYTNGTHLATALHAAVVTSDPSLALFVVSYDALTDTIRIDSGGVLARILWTSGPHRNASLYQVLGFEREDTDALVVHVADGRVDLTGARVLHLFLDELSTVLDAKPFATVVLSPTSTTPCFYAQASTTSMRFDAVPKLNTLTLRILVPYVTIDVLGNLSTTYRPYQFNRAQVVLTLRFTSHMYSNTSLSVIGMT